MAKNFFRKPIWILDLQELKIGEACSDLYEAY